jgi:RNA polymerase sigma-70 factor, ECF subfamily
VSVSAPLLRLRGWSQRSQSDAERLDAHEALGSLAEIYASALPEVYRYLSARCGSAAVAEDLTQETFVAAAKAVQRRPVDVNVGWLITIARNKMIDHFRRAQVESKVAVMFAASSVPDELVVWQGEASRDVAGAALAALPAPQRSVLVLRYLDGMSVSEVAAAIGRSVHATESLLARARDNFKRLYVEGIDV